MALARAQPPTLAVVVNGCADCESAIARGFVTCSFHRVSYIDFDSTEDVLKIVHVVPAEPDDTEW